MRRGGTSLGSIVKGKEEGDAMVPPSRQPPPSAPIKGEMADQRGRGGS